ncbi:MAG: hypothetical protein KGL54_13425 [Sphingomonadales bacterium]|nr:hypothetical protein [Sphingomonadales bacterium]
MEAIRNPDALFLAARDFIDAWDMGCIADVREALPVPTPRGQPASTPPRPPATGRPPDAKDAA